jgi:diguanylate cyclase (GGDEF)-like protein
MPSGAGLSWFLGRLRIQFTLYVAAILVAFTALVLAINWQSQEQIVLDRLEAHVGYVADLTAILVQENLEDGNASALASVLKEIVELEDAMAVAVATPDGSVKAAERGIATSPSLSIPSGTILNGSPWPNSSARDGAQYIFATAPVRAGDSVVATVHLARALLRPGAQPGSSILSNAEFGAEASSLQQIITRNVLIGLGMFALAIPLAGFLMNRATRGISDVTDAARQAAEGNLDVVLATSGSGEVVELQTSFRKMQEELKTNIREIETLAYTDSVTGLANRARFQAHLSSALESGEIAGGAVLLIDLDNFKTVNDTFGHRFGDVVLNHVSKKLEEIVFKTCRNAPIANFMIARFVGDGFVVFVDIQENDPALRRLSTELIEGLGDLDEIEGKRIHLACSVGVTTFSNNSVTVEQILQQADLAMYSAKKHGRRQARFFSDEIMVAAERRAELERSLRGAVRNNELVVYYQPKVSFQTRCIVGAEALVRWTDPARGAIPPSEFIPIAEEAGLITDIGLYVLRQSLKDFKGLHTAGHSLTIAVNVSAQQLQRPDFVSTVSAALADCDFPPQCLEIELTESEAILTSDLQEDPMQQLRERGVRFAIDDFGTGHSNLSRLPSFQFDTLKIDKSFVDNLAKDESNQAIVQLTLSLARTLNMEVVTEGVECEEDFLILQKGGAHIAQGYLFGAPMPYAKFEENLRLNAQVS